MPDLAQPVELSFVFQTIAVILVLTAVGIFLVKLRKGN